MASGLRIAQSLLYIEMIMVFLVSELLKAIRSYLEANLSLRLIVTGIWALATTPEILKCIQMATHLTPLKISLGSGITSITTPMRQTLKVLSETL